MSDKSVSDLVNSYVNFSYGINPKGWSRCYCEVCGDGKRTKGPRGGWIFEGDMAFYNCFNCGVDGNFDPHREHPFSKDMRKIFEAFGIPQREYNAVAYADKMSADKSNNVKKPEKKFIPVQYFDIPEHFYPLADAALDNVVANAARKFLREKYALTQDSYPFYLSTGIVKNEDIRQVAIAKTLAGRLIIPYFKNGKMIYYQARALDNKSPKKYINMDVPKTNIIFNMDQLYRNLDRPLYVFEGAMDAIHVDGVAVMENNLTVNQIEILNKSPRRKVIVPDRNSDSSKLIDLGVIEQGWGVSLPEIGSSSKDICEGILKFGKLHVLNSLVKKTYFGQEAKMMCRFV
ncbi:DNA primase [Xanthomonas phage Xoo-sp13]|nr:DNA primase [Xanthomonas phage Xoo-sp13]